MIESGLLLLSVIKLDSNRVCSGKYILGIPLCYNSKDILGLQRFLFSEGALELTASKR